MRDPDAPGPPLPWWGRARAKAPPAPKGKAPRRQSTPFDWSPFDADIQAGGLADVAARSGRTLDAVERRAVELRAAAGLPPPAEPAGRGGRFDWSPWDAALLAAPLGRVAAIAERAGVSRKSAAARQVRLRARARKGGD